MFFTETNQIIIFLLDKIKEKSNLIYALLVFSILIAVFWLVKIEKKRKKNLKRIIEGMKEVSRDNFDFRVEIKSGDELGELAKYFNEMTKQLKKTKLALEEAKATLEIKVAARTRELEELAETREEIIEERTKELLEQLKELEKFYRLAVGRELKMIELKKEIQKIQSKTRTKPKNKNYGTKRNQS